MLRILAIGAVVFALLVVVKDHRLLERVHLVGSCTTVTTAADGTEWRSCVAGRVSGRPSLAQDGCTDAGPRGGTELWRCPAPLAANVSRQ